MLKKLLPILLLAFCGFHSGCFSVSADDESLEKYSRELPPKKKHPWPEKLDSLSAGFDQWFAQKLLQTGTPGAAVVIVKDTNIIFCKGYGQRAAGRPEKTDAETVFRIGSLSKGFAAVLAGILVEQKTLAWDDRVTKHCPEFSLRDPAQAKRMKLTHLLSHTTGLPFQAYTNLVEEGRSLREMMKLLPKVKLFAKEGQRFGYQNVAFSVAGEAMASASGKTFVELLEEKVFRPAGMTRASATFEEISGEENRAEPLGYPGGISKKYYQVAPAGGVNASAKDMGQWLKLLLGHRPEIVSDSTLNFVFSPRIESHVEYRHFQNWPGYDKQEWYALGWRVLRNEGKTYVLHGGSVNNFKAEIALSRESGLGICVLTNAMTGLAGEAVPHFFEVFSERKD